MKIIEKLSSQCGKRPEESNRLVAEECIADPGLLVEVGECLASKDAKLAGDCAEVCTMVASTRPDLIAPLGKALEEIRLHKTTRVRWETAHSLALIAAKRPELIGSLIPGLLETIRNDESIIVRDYSIDILANYASSGEAAAKTAFPGLVESLLLWGGRHAGHALTGLEFIARMLPEMRDEIMRKIQPFLKNEKQVIRKAAEKVEKACR